MRVFQVQFSDYGSERIIDVGRLYVLTPQFCGLNRQGVRCRLSAAGPGVEMPASVVSRSSLVDVLLNKLVVVSVLAMIDEDACRVTLPLCDQNLQQIPQLARFSICLSVCLSTHL